MTQIKSSVIFLKDWKPLVQSLPPDKQLIFWDLFINFHSELECEDISVKPIWNFIKSQLVNMENKYNENIVNRNKTNGLKGGRPRTQDNPKNPMGLSETQITLNDNEKDNDNENNKENNIFGDTTDSSDDSDLWQEENNQLPPDPKPDLPPKTPKKERKTPNTVHHKCVDFYYKEFRPIGWGEFTVKDGAKFKSLIEKITKTLIDYKIEPTDETILEKFKSLMLNLPDFYKNQDLSTIDSKYHVIFNELKSKGNQSIIKENKPWLRPNLTVEEQMALTTEQKNEWARVILNVNI